MESLIVNTTIFGSTLLIYVTVIFLISQIKEDNSLMDIAYGPAFFISALNTIFFTVTHQSVPLIIVVLLAIWSLRLSFRIFRKNFGKPEDVRYAKWRQEWMKKGQFYFTLRSYLQINLLQGFIILIVSLPFIIAVSFPDQESSLFLILGTIIFGIGLAIETLADHQLDRFLACKKAGVETSTIMTSGLFRYSRRPNYFGETLIWWGLFVIVLPLPFGLLAILSPLLITYIVTKVTGPMLEAVFLEKYPEEYKAYMDKTSYFIPLPPKS